MCTQLGQRMNSEADEIIVCQVRLGWNKTVAKRCTKLIEENRGNKWREKSMKSFKMETPWKNEWNFDEKRQELWDKNHSDVSPNRKLNLINVKSTDRSCWDRDGFFTDNLEGRRDKEDRRWLRGMVNLKAPETNKLRQQRDRGIHWRKRLNKSKENAEVNHQNRWSSWARERERTRVGKRYIEGERQQRTLDRTAHVLAAGLIEKAVSEIEFDQIERIETHARRAREVAKAHTHKIENEREKKLMWSRRECAVDWNLEEITNFNQE